MVLREQDQTEEDEGDDENDENDDDDDVEVKPEDTTEAEKPRHKAKHCTVLVELLQRNRRQKDKLNFLYIAFHVYRVSELWESSLCLFCVHVSSPAPLFSSRSLLR